MKKLLIWAFGITSFVLVVKFTFLAQASQCAQLESEGLAKLSELSRCSTDEDCTVIGLSCPFECATALNKQNVDEMMGTVKTYQKQCMMLCPECPKTIPNRSSCINNVCTALDSRLL